MILISHRGNLDGPIPDKENSPSYINDALQKGFDVEVDVWYNDGSWFLGHDEPQYPIDLGFLKNPHLWCHAKNIDALRNMLNNNVHCFWHQEDEHTLTSKGWIWAYPGSQLTEVSIAVMPKNKIVEKCAGVCCDYIQEYKE